MEKFMYPSSTRHKILQCEHRQKGPPIFYHVRFTWPYSSTILGEVKNVTWLKNDKIVLLGRSWILRNNIFFHLYADDTQH